MTGPPADPAQRLAQVMADHQVPAAQIAIVADGHITATTALGVGDRGMTTTADDATAFAACSVSKLVAALVTLLLAEQDHVDLSGDVRSVLPVELTARHDRTTPLTLRDLLCHHGGLVDPDGDVGAVAPEVGIPPAVDVLAGTTTLASRWTSPLHEPGTAFTYSDTGYCVIQAVVEELTGQPFADVATELVLEPLAMRSSAYDPATAAQRSGRSPASGHTTNGQVVAPPHPHHPYPAASGLWSSAADLARLVVEVAAALDGDGATGLSADGARDLLAPHGTVAWTGLGLFRERDPSGRLRWFSQGWGPGFQCLVRGTPDTRGGDVVMINTDPGTEQMDGPIGALLAALGR